MNVNVNKNKYFNKNLVENKMTATCIWEYGPVTTQTINNIADVVTGVSWICKCTDDEYPGIVGFDSGVLNISELDPDHPTIITDLTSAIVEGWMSTYLNKPEIEQRCLEYLLDQIATPIKVVPIPAVDPETGQLV